MENVQ